LGPFGVNAKPMVHRVLFDVLCPSGTGWTVMGYESVTVPVDTTHPQTMQPYTAQVPLFEDCYWTWFSPKQATRAARFQINRLGQRAVARHGVRDFRARREAEGVGAGRFRRRGAVHDTHFDHGTNGHAR
jgi:hypothetical protein